jgi:hypothetical protein
MARTEVRRRKIKTGSKETNKVFGPPQIFMGSPLGRLVKPGDGEAM